MRTVPEWIGKTDDSGPPPRVKLRVLDRYVGRCGNPHCLRVITTGTHWQCDHIIAIINGGQNRETNLQPLCRTCHMLKTDRDVAIKAKTHRIRTKHLGLRKPKGRALPGTKRSGIRKRMSGKVERW